MKITEILTELIGIKGQLKTLPRPAHIIGDEDGGKAWEKIMRGNGFVQAGFGSYASVWRHPKLTYVLKLFDSSDQAYIDWVSVAMANKNNPHMPKFISSKLVPITPDVVAIRMESLRHIQKDSKLYYVYEFSDNRIATEPIPPSQVIIDDIELLQSYRNWELTNEYCKNHPQWLEALDIMWNFIKSSGHDNDFHSGNCMVRDTDTLVITDPVV